MMDIKDIKLGDILKNTDLTYEQFIEFCILLLLLEIFHNTLLIFLN